LFWHWFGYRKRRGELINAQVSGKTRRALDGYNVQFADIALSISIPWQLFVI
jgi:hypothetical protein